MHEKMNAFSFMPDAHDASSILV